MCSSDLGLGPLVHVWNDLRVFDSKEQVAGKQSKGHVELNERQRLAKEASARRGARQAGGVPRSQDPGSTDRNPADRRDAAGARRSDNSPGLTGQQQVDDGASDSDVQCETGKASTNRR